MIQSDRVLNGKYVIGSGIAPVRYEMGCGETSEYIQDAKLYDTFEKAYADLISYINPSFFKIYFINNAGINQEVI